MDDATTTEPQGTDEPQETPRQAFVRLANDRLEYVEHRLQQIGKLAARKGDYTDAHVDGIFTAVDRAVQNMKDQFRPPANAAPIRLRVEGEHGITEGGLHPPDRPIAQQPCAQCGNVMRPFYEDEPPTDDFICEKCGAFVTNPE